MKLRHYSLGHLTLEILVAATILIFCATLSYTPSTTFLRQYHRMQVRIATQHFASDIRKLQQKAIFGNNISDKIVILPSNEGYYWDNFSKNERIITYFNSIGCEGVIFEKKLAALAFSSTGAPSATGSFIYELKHRSDNGFGCKLIVQVSSGRLDISETI